MSSVAELAKQEGDDAEAAEEDETPTPAPEPEPEPDEPPAPPQPAQMTEQEAEREFKKLEGAAQRYLKAAMPITEKLGMPVQACPLCTFPGLAIPRAAHEVTSDVEAAVLALIGKNAPRNLRPALDAEECPDCDGEGDVLTGAKKEIAREKPCTRCGGKGWVQKMTPIPAPAANGAAQFPGATLPYTPLPQGVPDQWGRPAGHIHWGIDPANVGV